MPNIKSAIKRVAVNSKRESENRGIKSEVATTIKKYKALIANGELDKAKQEYSHVVSVVDGAVSKGILKKENADRKKARLALALNKAEAK